jgi:putative hydrolase of the HAD superfamily
MSPRAAAGGLVVDLDGVLRIWDPGIVASAERRAGLPPGALDRAAFADAATLRAVVTGRISDAEWRAGIAARLVAVHGEAAAGAVADWSGPCGEVDQRVLAVLREQRRSRPVALPSNATDRLPRDLQRLGLDGGLDAVVNSSELGLAKPDPEVFVAVCSALGLPPYRCLFVDDQQVNVDAAARVGLRAHPYRGPGEPAAVLQDGSG